MNGNTSDAKPKRYRVMIPELSHPRAEYIIEAKDEDEAEYLAMDRYERESDHNFSIEIEEVARSNPGLGELQGESRPPESRNGQTAR